MSKKKDIYWRAYLIYFGFAIVMLVVMIKTITLQVTNVDPTFLSSNNGQEKIKSLFWKKTPFFLSFFSTKKKKKKGPPPTERGDPRRGQILDANYTPLV